MLSALVLVPPNALGDPAACIRDVAKTLGALVGLVVADLVSDALVVTRPGVDFEPLEETAGCQIVTNVSLGAALAEAAGRARRERLLLLRPGLMPDRAFSDEIVSALELKPDEPRSVRMAPETLLQRLVPGIAPIAALVVLRARLPVMFDEKLVTLDHLADRAQAQMMRAKAFRL